MTQESKTPLVSVLMPMFNASRYLHEVIDSILVQSFTDYEFLIVDDGSNDDSVAIARSYEDGRIRVLAEPHLGLVATRNKCLTEARGRYMAWTDADDRSAPERLLKQVTFMEANPQIVAVGTWAQAIDSLGQSIDDRMIPPTGGKL